MTGSARLRRLAMICGSVTKTMLRSGDYAIVLPGFCRDSKSALGLWLR
jgi:hypothetical protein